MRKRAKKATIHRKRFHKKGRHFFSNKTILFIALSLITVSLLAITLIKFGTGLPNMFAASKKDPALEQQIDIQDTSLSTTSKTYTDAAFSGDFVWNASRYSSLQNVYFEAGIANNTAVSSTKRVRSANIAANLVSGTTYKVRTKYSCAYNSTANTFTETGYAELWSADNTTEVTSSAVKNVINTGTGKCPAALSTVNVRFSRIIILQSDPNLITDTNTAINIGHTETQTFADTNEYPLQSPKIWLYTDHTKHPASGWDAIKDVIFSATLASPNGASAAACLYDITSNTEITCVSTKNTTPTYVTSSDISQQLTDGDQYETYLKSDTPATQVTLYNSFVTVEQSNSRGLAYIELYHDFNPYPVTSSAQNGYAQEYFPNYWQPVNFNIQPTQTVPAADEVLSFHMETTEQTQSATTASTMLFQNCVPGSTTCTNATVYASNMDTASTTPTRIRTADNAYPMPPTYELDTALGIYGTNGTATSNVTWLIINVTILPAYYSVQETQNLTYGPNPYETYDQCVPVNAPPNRPGLIYIHGGAWMGGDKSGTVFQSLCNAYAAQGYIVDDINYSLTASAAGSRQWTNQIGDVQLAVRNLRSNASSLGLDPNHICAYGDSAGAHLSLLLDELQSVHPADMATESAMISPTVQCAVDQFGPADLAKLYTEAGPGSKAYPAIYDLLDDQTPTSNPALYTDASPVDNVASQTGPVFITQGTQDTTVLPDQGPEMQQALQAAGIPNNFMGYNAEHEYSGLTTQQTNMIREQIDAWLVAQEHP